MQGNTKWKTQSIFIDMDTGEIIDKNNIENYHVIITEKVKTEVNEKSNTITRIYQHHCRERKQLKLFNEEDHN